MGDKIRQIEAVIATQKQIKSFAEFQTRDRHRIIGLEKQKSCEVEIAHKPDLDTRQRDENWHAGKTHSDRALGVEVC